ncbi:MAG: hypothetical protein KH440_10565 [Oscillospiraceae bacterium]|nr:hypothetical protein [Oscillospiraceae bacterium]
MRKIDCAFFIKTIEYFCHRSLRPEGGYCRQQDALREKEKGWRKLMNVVVALIPALLWGLVPLLVVKIGGEPIQQLGTAFGCGIFAVAIYLFARPEATVPVMIGCVISGIGWSVGQLMQ